MGSGRGRRLRLFSGPETSRGAEIVPDIVTLVVGSSAVFNTALLTGIFYRLGSLGARLNAVERRNNFEQ
jgi:hypothetical protein